MSSSWNTECQNFYAHKFNFKILLFSYNQVHFRMIFQMVYSKESGTPTKPNRHIFDIPILSNSQRKRTHSVHSFTSGHAVYQENFQKFTKTAKMFFELSDSTIAARFQKLCSYFQKCTLFLYGSLMNPRCISSGFILVDKELDKMSKSVNLDFVWQCCHSLPRWGTIQYCGT